jgi:hypothetical protein
LFDVGEGTMSSWKRAPVGINTIQRSRITNENGPFVSVILRGGLGNRCFQILCGLGYAERHGKRFVLSETHILSNAHTKKDMTQNILFALFPSVKIYRGPVNWTVMKEPEFGEDCVLKHINGSVLLDGYFQNEAYFPTDARAKFIVPKPEKTVFDVSGLDFSKICFVHFRYGDYLASDYAFDMTKYYKDCVDSCGKDVRFLVFSDQPHLINLEKHGLDPGRSVIVPNTVGPWETLYLMSLCSEAICPNSTFSWFGAFAMRGLGQVFMPNKWHKVLDYVPLASWAKFMPID